MLDGLCTYLRPYPNTVVQSVGPDPTRRGHIQRTSSPNVSVSALKWEFPKIGVPYFGVLIIRILLFRVPYFRKLPNLLVTRRFGSGFVFPMVPVELPRPKYKMQLLQAASRPNDEDTDSEDTPRHIALLPYYCTGTLLLYYSMVFMSVFYQRGPPVPPRSRSHSLGDFPHCTNKLLRGCFTSLFRTSCCQQSCYCANFIYNDATPTLRIAVAMSSTPEAPKP